MYKYTIAILVTLVLFGKEGMGDETLPFITVDPKGFLGSVRDLAISDDGRWLAAAGSKEVRIWDLNNPADTPRAVLRGFQLQDGLILGRTNAVSFSPGNNPKYLAVGVSDNTELGSTRIYEMSDLSRFQLLKGHSACTDRVAFSNDGTVMGSYG